MSHPSADGWLFLILALMKIIFLSCVVFFLLACHQDHPPTCRLVVSMVGTSADSVLLRRISLNNDPSRTIDSGFFCPQKIVWFLNYRFRLTACTSYHSCMQV